LRWVSSRADPGSLHLPDNTTFSRSKQGAIIDALSGIETPISNPLIIIDEIDKSSAEKKYDPVKTLLPLTEKSDAQEFQDSFFKVPVDASGINYIALANSLSELPKPVLSRFRVIEIKPYDKDGMLIVARHIISKILEEQGDFVEELKENVLRPESIRTICEIADYFPRNISAAFYYFLNLGEDFLPKQLLQRPQQSREIGFSREN
jgi:ATP-dependent Lon protease